MDFSFLKTEGLKKFINKTLNYESISESNRIGFVIAEVSIFLIVWIVLLILLFSFISLFIKKDLQESVWSIVICFLIFYIYFEYLYIYYSEQGLVNVLSY